MANLGTDIGDFDARGTLISGRRLHATDLAWRFRTPNGTHLTDPNYGYDLAQHLNDTLSVEQLPAIANRMELECEKDERTRPGSASVQLALQEIGGAKVRLRAAIDIEDGDGQFRFIVDVTSDDFTVEFLQGF